MGLTDKIYKNAGFELETVSDGDVQTVRGDCLYRLVTGGFELFFKEEQTDTRIVLTAENVIFERKGDVSYKIDLRPKKQTTTDMKTPYGKIPLTVEGKDMLYMPTAEGFDAIFRYDMYPQPNQSKVEMTVSLRVKY